MAADNRTDGTPVESELPADEVAGMAWAMNKPAMLDASTVAKAALEGSLFNIMSCVTLEPASLSADERAAVSRRSEEAVDMIYAGLQGISELMIAYDPNTGGADDAMSGLGWMLRELSAAGRQLNVMQSNAAYARLLHACKGAARDQL
jgi:hypothetical protein